MNKILGLITKDILLMKSYSRIMIIFVIIAIGNAFSMEGAGEISTLVVFMLTFGSSMAVFSTFSIDEQAKSNRYILCMPFTKKELVLEKYILISANILISSIIGMFVSVVISYALVRDIPKFTDLISCAIGAIFALSLIECIQIPFVYKFGVEKARIWIFIMVLAFSFLLGAIATIIDSNQLNSAIAFLKQSNILSLSFPILITLLMYYISYKISYRIYCKKDV